MKTPAPLICKHKEKTLMKKLWQLAWDANARYFDEKSNASYKNTEYFFQQETEKITRYLNAKKKCANCAKMKTL